LAFGLVLAILESGGIELPRYFPIPAINAWGLALGLVCLTILPLSSVNQALAEFAEQAHQELAARRREEHARFEADSRFRATFFQAAVGIAHTGLDGRWLLLNERLCEILGYSPDELSHKTLLETTHPEDCEASQTALQQLVAGEISSWSKEKRYIRKDGGIVWGRVFT
jgi:PAS domain S-box-containing protein